MGRVVGCQLARGGTPPFAGERSLRASARARRVLSVRAAQGPLLACGAEFLA